MIHFIPRPVVYIAGPFSGHSGYEVERNVRRAEAYILPIAEAGGAPLCPHTMTRTFDGTLTYEEWIAITLTHLLSANAILMTRDWHGSAGARGEEEFARKHASPRFYAVDDEALPLSLLDWLADEIERRRV